MGNRTRKFLLLAIITFAIYSISKRKLPKSQNYTPSISIGNPKDQIVMATFYKDLDKLTLQNLYDYASKHNYILIIADEHFSGKVPSDKYEIIERIFREQPNIEWLFWVSPDSLFLNHQIKIQSFLDDRFDLIVPISPLKEIRNMIQTDNFLIRNSETGRAILQEIIKNKGRHCGHFILENPRASLSIDGWLNVCQDDGAFWNGDIGIIMGLSLYTKYKCLIRKVSERRFSSRFPRYTEGDFVLSFSQETSLPMKNALIRGALKYMNTEGGKIDRTRTNSLQPEEDLAEIKDDDSNINGCHYDDNKEKLLNVTQLFIIEPTNEAYWS